MSIWNLEGVEDKMMIKTPYIEKITVKLFYEHFKDNIEDEFDLKAYPEDRKRIEAYYNEEWYYMGIFAEAEILKSYYADSKDEDESKIDFKQIYGTVSSGGLWGIESDSGIHIEEVKQEQIEELKVILKDLNVMVPNDVEIETVMEYE